MASLRPGLVRAGLACALGITSIGAAAIGVATLAQVTLRAQEQFTFVVSVMDEKGVPVSDLKPTDVVMTEDGKPATVVRLEPFSLPAKVTIAVDNSRETREALEPTRKGLITLIDALPNDVEVTLMTTAPQPRTIARPTMSHDELKKAVALVSPEDASPRFTDAFVEYAKRMEKETKDKTTGYLPVLLMVATPTKETSTYQVDQIQKALQAFLARRAKLYVTMTVPQRNDPTAATQISANPQAQLSIAATKAVGGRYEGIEKFERVQDVLPDFGHTLSDLHQKHAHQFRVTVTRPAGMTGQLQNPAIQISRPGLQGAVSLDGYLP